MIMHEASKRPLPKPKTAPPPPPDGGPVCTCPLIDISGFEGEYRYALGKPDGCPRHDKGERYDKRLAAERLARYGEPA